MTKGLPTIIDAIFGKSDLSAVMLEEIHELIREYPSFNAAHFLLSKKLIQENDGTAQSENSRTALYFNNAFWLQQLLIEDKLPLPQPIIASPLPVETNKEEPAKNWSPVEEYAAKNPDTDVSPETVSLEIKKPFAEKGSEEEIEIPIEKESEPASATVTSFDELLSKYKLDEEPKGEFFEESLNPELNETPIPELIRDEKPKEQIPPVNKSSREEIREEIVNEYGVFEEIVTRKMEPDPDSLEGLEFEENEVKKVQQRYVQVPDIPAQANEDLEKTRQDNEVLERPIQNNDVLESPLQRSEILVTPTYSVERPEIPVQSGLPDFDLELKISQDDLDAFDKPKKETQEIQIEESFPVDESAPPVWEKDIQEETVSPPIQNQMSYESLESKGAEILNSMRAGFSGPGFEDNGEEEEIQEKREPIEHDFEAFDRPIGNADAGDEDQEPVRVLPHFDTQKAGSIVYTPYHMVDYFASQGIKLVLEDNPSDSFGKQLKSFTDWLKVLKKAPAQTAIERTDEREVDKIRHFAAHSVEERDILTESMAEVLAKQGMYENAIALYQKLSLIYPPKSAYFASRIEQLKASLP